MMAAAPKYKVYDRDGKYQASCHEVEAAAFLMSLYGDGATIRTGHEKRWTVWVEGDEKQPADQSWDYVVITVQEREHNNIMLLAHDMKAGKFRR